MKYLPIALALAMTGCASTNILPPAASGQTSDIAISASGLKQHDLYPDDVVWLNIFEQPVHAGDHSIARYRLTLDEMAASFPTDSDRSYTYAFYSIESHFGGYSSCHAVLPIEPTPGFVYQVHYETDKESCSVTLSMFNSDGSPVGAEMTYPGVLAGGVQYRVSTH